MPDDAKIISDDLSIDESALTGMSFPEEKEGADIVYFGSVVRRDKAKRVVVNTGVSTYFGMTAELVGHRKVYDAPRHIGFSRG